MPRPQPRAATQRREKPEGGSKRFADAKKNHNELLADCERLLLAEANDLDERRQDVIHPSEMSHSDWCPRSTFLRISLARLDLLPDVDPHHFQLENIFEEGHEYHRKWQARFRRMGRLQGQWFCEACYEKWFAVSPYECPACHAPSGCLTYFEVPLRDKAHLIHGSADGNVTESGLIEVKSIGEGTIRMELPRLLMKHSHDVIGEWGKTTKVIDTRGVWKDITYPFGPHLRQGFIYLRLYNAMAVEFGWPAIDKITFIYEFKPTSMVKAFDIERDDDAVQELWESAADIVYALDKGGREPSCIDRDEPCKHCQPYEAIWSKESEHDSRPTSREGEAEEEPRGRRRTRQEEPAATEQATRRRPRPRGAGPDGPRGRGADGPARDADQVGGLLGRAARRSGR